MEALRNCLGFFPAEEVDLLECSEEESKAVDGFDLGVCFPCRCSLSRRGELLLSRRGDLLNRRGDLLSLRGDLCGE